MMNWFVIHTKPRFEKKVEERLLSLGIEAYCPTRKEIRLWSDRKKKIDIPVLPSMVLVRLEEICDGFDNDCDGDVDEDLEQLCETDCETGVEFCALGSWVGCTAKVPFIEICNA